MEPTPGQDQPATEGDAATEAPRPRSVVSGLQIQPFGAFVAGWSALCGALATGSLQWSGETLLALVTAFLLVTLAWIGTWRLVSGSDWASLFRPGGHGPSPVSFPALPYTRAGSPAGRLGRELGRLASRWRETLGPEAGSSFIMLSLVISLAVVLSLVLSPRIRWLNLVVLAVVTLGIAGRRRGRAPLVAPSILYLGLPWLAGYLAVARFRWPALLFALFFSLSAWGLSRLARGMAGGTSLLLGGQFAVALVLGVLGRFLAAGVVSLLAFGPALHALDLRFGGDLRGVARRTWPWLLAALLAASLLRA